MKVRNIVFSGFAAAILMGTANAAPFRIASQQYVDSKTSTGLVDNQNNPISVADAIDEIKDELDTKADAADVTALDDAIGDGFSAQNTVADAIDGKQDKLSGGTGYEGKVVTAGATDGAVTYTAIDSAFGDSATSNLVTNSAVRSYVAGQIQNVTGGATVGTLPNDPDTSQPYTTVGDALTDVNTALNNKLDKSATSSTLPAAASAVATNYANELAVANALATKADATDLATLDTQINGDPSDATDGLAGTVAALNTQLNDQTSGLAAAVAQNTTDIATKQDALSADQLGAIAKLVDGYASCIQQAEALREAGDNSAAHCVLSASTAGGVEWTPVTFPWAE